VSLGYANGEQDAAGQVELNVHAGCGCGCCGHWVVGRRRIGCHAAEFDPVGCALRGVGVFVFAFPVVEVAGFEVVVMAVGNNALPALGLLLQVMLDFGGAESGGFAHEV
jgi:hypothetical protein